MPGGEGGVKGWVWAKPDIANAERLPLRDSAKAIQHEHELPQSGVQHFGRNALPYQISLVAVGVFSVSLQLAPARDRVL